MTNFEDKDVEFFETHGNKIAQSIWRAKWDPNQNPKPKSTDEKGIKDFIQKTYVKKQWYDESGRAPSKAAHEDVPVQPIQNIIQNPPKVEVTRNTPVNKQQETQESNLFSFEPVVTNKQTTQAPQPKSNVGGGLDDFFGGSSHTTTNTSSGFGDDNWGFPSSGQSQQQQAPTTQPKATINVDDLFAGFGGPTTQPQTGGWNQPQTGGWNQPTQPQHGGWNQPQTGGWNQPQTGGWNQPQPQTGGWNQPTQPQHGGWNQPQTGGWNQPQPGFGGPTQPQTGGWNQPQHGGWNQPTQPQTGGWNQPSQPQTGGWNQPPQKRNLQDSPPPRDPFSGLTGIGGSSSHQQPSKANDNPFDF